jgi:uncharacterized protein
MRVLARLIIRFPLAILVFATAVATLGAFCLADLRMSFSIDPLIEGDSKERERTLALEAEMPQSPADLVLLLSWEKAIGAAELKQLRRISAALRERPRVKSVRSLPEVPVVLGGGLLPRLGPFSSTLAAQESALEAAQRHPLLVRRLISADGRSAALLIAGHEDRDEGSFDLLTDIEARLPALVPAEATWRLIGPDLARRSMRDTMVRDLKRSLGLGLLAFAFVLPLIFRSWRGVILPLFAVIVSILGALGPFVAAGMSLGLIDVAVPAIMVAIGVCDAIHLVHAFETARARGQGRRRATLRALREVGLACFFTSFTTAIGFLSLLVAEHPEVRLFGIKSALAVLWTFLCVVTVIPALLTLWPEGAPRIARVPGFRTGRFPSRRQAFAGALLLLAIVVSGTMRLRIDARWMEELPDRAPIVRDLRWFEENFGGLLTLDIRLDGDLRDPDFARRIDDLRQALEQEEGVNRSECYLDWIREVTREKAELDRPRLERGFGALALVPQWFPHHVLRPDGGAGRLILATSDRGTGHFFHLRDRVRTLTASWPEGQRAEVTGYMLMAHRSSRLVVTTMLQSFALSLFIICLLVGFAFRSWRVGLVVIVPNVLPVAVALGLQGWLDLPLRIGIVMIYALGLGLAVDDSIHFVSRYRFERRRRDDEDPQRAAERALESTGGALLVTSTVLLLSALSYLPSGFRSLRDVGILLATVVAVALWSDLVLLPRWLVFASRRRSATANGKS